jgi:hypothetical protein
VPFLTAGMIIEFSCQKAGGALLALKDCAESVSLDEETLNTLKRDLVTNFDSYLGQYYSQGDGTIRVAIEATYAGDYYAAAISSSDQDFTFKLQNGPEVESVGSGLQGLSIQSKHLGLLHETRGHEHPASDADCVALKCADKKNNCVFLRCLIARKRLLVRLKAASGDSDLEAWEHDGENIDFPVSAPALSSDAKSAEKSDIRTEEEMDEGRQVAPHSLSKICVS